MKKVTIIGCEEALRLLFSYLDRELDAHRHAEVERHLSICRSCYSRAEFEKHLKTRLRDTGSEAVPAALKQRIKKLISSY